jgi:probable selenium-dependent hydroxylase accessory protein YqeC
LIEASVGERVLAAARGLTGNNKVKGLDKEAIDRLFISGIFDYILVEADGAKHKILKAPAPFEPQVPERATCVVLVAGVDILGRPLSDEYVHRYQIAAKISGQRIGTPVTAATLLSLFKYYRQILNKISAEMRIVPVLNKVDNRGLLHKAKEAAKVLIPEVGMVLITSTLLPEPVWEVVV